MKTIILQIVFTLIAIEIIFRLFGYSPYSIQKYSLTSVPENYILADDSLGFRLNAGVFNVTINDSVKYTASHNALGQRISDFSLVIDSSSTKTVLFGGSFPYGMGVDDTLSYSYLVNYNGGIYLENQCVSGYGMTQAIIQTQRELKTKSLPFMKEIILHYASFYDDRNALTPDYRVALHHGFMNSSPEARKKYSGANYPYIKGEKWEDFEIDFVQLDKIYSNWWLREYSASINFLQTLIDKNSSTYSISNLKSQWIIQQLHEQYCKPNGINLIIATITNDEKTDKIKAFCKQQNIEVADLFVDYTQPKYSNLPHDSHPNAKAHEIYAKKIVDFFE